MSTESTYRGVYRAEYRDKKTGRRMFADTWISTFWDPKLKKTVKAYGFVTAAAAAKHRAARSVRAQKALAKRLQITTKGAVIR